MTDDLTRALLHATRQNHLDLFDWDKAADTLAPIINSRCRMARKAQLSDLLMPSLPALKGDGLAVLPLSLNAQECADVREDIRQHDSYPGHHVRSVSRAGVYVPGDRYQCYEPEFILRAPHLLGFALEPAIVDLMEAALGCVPTLYSVNLWWTYPTEGDPWPPHSQTFHRDDDDFRFFTLFVYLTDVERLEDGPNQIVRRSHTWAGLDALAESGLAAGLDMGSRFPKSEIPAECVTSTLGRAGTAFVADTRALHRGVPPIARSRLMFWARYGLGPNTNSSDVDLPLGPVPKRLIAAPIANNHRNRYVTRMLIDWR